MAVTMKPQQTRERGSNPSPDRYTITRGGEFENQLFEQLQKYSGITRSQTTPYHPQGNGQVERFNRTLLQMLKTLTEKQKSNWKNSLNKMIYAYNCTKNNMTGFSPFYLLFGRSPRLPIDVLFGLNTDNPCISQSEYLESWKQGMQEALEIAREHAKKTSERNKKYYDQKVRCTDIDTGGRVLVKNLTPRGGPGKLRNYWEEQVYVVVRRVAEDVPIYEVKPERGKGRSRVLHRNLLMPCDHLPLEIDPTPKPKSKRIPPSKNTRARGEGTDESDLESESDYEYYVPAQTYQLEQQPSSYGKSKGNVLSQSASPELLVQRDATDDSVSLQCDLEHLPSAEAEHDVRVSIHEPAKENRSKLPQNQMVRESGSAHGSLPEEQPAHTVGLSDRSDEVQGGYQYQGRPRRPPRKFTYDSLGTPTCYNVQVPVPEYTSHHANLWTPSVIPWVPMVFPCPRPQSVCY